MKVNQVTLSPPQYILFNRIKSSIGADPTLRIPNIYLHQDIYRIDIISDSLRKARALAGILISSYDFGGIKVNVQVFYRNRLHPVEPPARPPELVPVIAAKRLIDRALLGNPLFIKTLLVSPGAPTTLGKIAIEFDKQVLQYYADNISDYFGNNNEVAAFVFQAVIRKTLYRTVGISVTTKPDNS